MKVSYCSDLHFSPDNEKPIYNTNKSDVLILAGDIINYAYDIKSMRLFDIISNEFDVVLWVLGNHEHWGGQLDTTHDIIRNELSGLGNILLLENQTYTKNYVNFIGATLWTDFNKANPIAMWDAKKQMRDYRYIKQNETDKLLPEDIYHKHCDSLAYIKRETRKSTTNVVITHHAPSYQSIAEEYKNSNLSPAYCSNLDDVMYNHNIDVWVHGHVHSKFDYMVGRTNVLSNPHGYRSEKISKNFELCHFEC